MAASAFTNGSSTDASPSAVSLSGTKDDIVVALEVVVECLIVARSASDNNALVVTAAPVVMLDVLSIKAGVVVVVADDDDENSTFVSVRPDSSKVIAGTAGVVTVPSTYSPIM